MTERRRSSLHREASSLSIGPSSLAWDRGVLTIDFDEVTAPIATRIQGTIRIHPGALSSQVFTLDGMGRHAWRPIAPRARVEVFLARPACAWRGDGYFDTNAGGEPLERAFSTWSWSRAHLARDSLLFYDVERRDGQSTNLALRLGDDGKVQAIQPPPRARLPSTFWRMGREARADLGDPPRVLSTLEDAPFYSRSMLDGRHGGEPARIVHESLSLDRLRSPVVRAMLTVKMPRVLA